MIWQPWRVAPILTGTLLVLALTITALPYLVLNPYFPMGSDLQHPLGVKYLIDWGQPIAQSAEIDEFYPNTFSHFVAAFSLLTGVEVLSTFKLMGVLLMLSSALAVYILARGLFGSYPALLTLLAYGLLSFQPRQTVDDMTLVDVLASYGILPLFLLTLHQLLITGNRRYVVLTALLGGALIRFHFLATTQAAAVVIVFLPLTLGIHRRLMTRRLLVNLGLAALLAALIGLPFTWRYATVYWGILAGRLGIAPPSSHEAVFPPVHFPGDLIALLGHMYFYLAVAAIAIFVLRELVARVPSPAVLLLTAWLSVVVVGFETKLFIAPERFVRALALPSSIAIGLMLYQLRERRVLLTGLVGVLVALGLPSVVAHQLQVAQVSISAEAKDVPSLTQVEALVRGQPDMRVLGDESGIWLPYYTSDNIDVIRGGPETFLWFGEPLRSRYQSFYEAMQAPCDAHSIALLRQQGIRYIYIGRKPGHWTPPGYTYNDGQRLLACSEDYSLVYYEKTTEGPIYIFQVSATP